MSNSLSAPPPIVEKPNVFSPPLVWIGSVVHWMRPGRERENCCAAIVQRVHIDGTVALSLIPPPQGGVPASAIDQTYVSVLHKDDPRLQQNDFKLRYGCWDLTEQDKQFRELQATVARLQRKQK